MAGFQVATEAIGGNRNWARGVDSFSGSDRNPLIEEGETNDHEVFLIG
jgi:hypothetical protein